MEIKKLPVMEIFGPTIQGEGLLAGKRSHFIRLGGCGYRCTWCDSMHAVDPKEVKKHAKKMSAHDIIEAVLDLNVYGRSDWVTISGGDPTMHNLEELIMGLRAAGQYVAIETQGQFYHEWMSKCNLVTISSKPPSSGMVDKFDAEVVENILLNCNAYFKIVIFTEEDLAWAINLHEMYPNHQMFLSVGTQVAKDNDSQIDISEAICHDLEQLYNAALKIHALHDVTILPQLHALAWGHEKGK